MRHGRKVNQLSRTKAHRDALMANMTDSLIKHKRIVTTVAKAKALRIFVEPLLTRAKTDSTHNRRMVFKYLQNKESIKELFGVVSEKIASRPGGYTRIIKMGFRPGDTAEIAMIELVDFNTTYIGTNNKKGGAATATAAPAKKTRRAGGAKKKADDAGASEA
ncbi:MAG: 50S ribosomal protein L17 [Bacteroidota bacterium]